MPTPDEQNSPGLYKSPRDAVIALRDEYHYWSGKVTDHSLQLSLGVLAANWAAFHSVEEIRKHLCAELSIVVVLVGLFAALVGALIMAELHKPLINKAESDYKQWQNEFENTADRENPWPFTKAIENWGFALRLLKLSPIIAFVLFLLALV